LPKFTNALLLPEQGSPGSPASGWATLFAKSGAILWTRTSGGAERLVEAGVLFPFSRAGTLTTGTGAHRIYNDTGATLDIKSVRATVGTAPTGASIIVDINVSGTTIFSTQGNRPTIAISGNTSGKVTNMNTTTIADGSYFTVDIDQIGSGTPGADLVVQILC
jgi:hypothetical protein